MSCLVSLDGSEYHHCGELKDEYTDFNGIRNSQEFINMHLSMPYLRLESKWETESAKADSIYNFYEKLFSEKLTFIIDSTMQEDFPCLSNVVKGFW